MIGFDWPAFGLGLAVGLVAATALWQGLARRRRPLELSAAQVGARLDGGPADPRARVTAEVPPAEPPLEASTLATNRVTFGPRARHGRMRRKRGGEA